jgi:hypothetical protein
MIPLTQVKPPMVMAAAAPRGKLAAVTCHFNFAGFQRPRQNLCRFVRQMRVQGVPLYGVELYKDDQQPFTVGWENWRQIKCYWRSIMFQKEALLNAVVHDLPAQFEHVAWVDADVMFGNPHWHTETVNLLELFKVVQLFSRCHFTGPDGKNTYSWPASATHARLDTSRGHPGFAWAARREFWHHGGLFPYSISGAGDVIIAAAIMNSDLPRDYAETLGEGADGGEWRKWEAGVREWCKGDFAHVAGDLWHEFHGTRDNRSYSGRKAALAAFKRERDLCWNADGILQFTEKAPRSLVDYLANYFAARREDG